MGTAQQKIDALLDAFDCGQAGLELIIQALSDKSRDVRDAAYWLLTQSTAEIAAQALWNHLPYARMQCLHTITGRGEREPNYFAISSDSRILVSNCHSEAYRYAYKTVNIWNLQTGDLIDSLFLPFEHMGSGRNGQLIVGHYQDVITTYNLATQQENQLVGGHEGNSDIGSLAVSLDGQTLVCGDLGFKPFDLLITVWDLDTRRLIHRLEWYPLKNRGGILSVLISPDGFTLLSHSKTASYDPHRLWNLQTGELIRTYESSRLWIADSLSVRPNGQTLAVGTREGIVKIWDLYTDEVIYSLPGYSPSAMTPDGKVLVFCTQAAEIIVWDIEMNQEICVLPGHSSQIRQIALSSNREWIASYSEDQMIKIWGVPE